MKSQIFTVKEVAQLAGVGIKTLHHYDAIGEVARADRVTDKMRADILGQLETRK